TPVGVIRPIFRAFPSANQRFPSGPDVMPETPATGVGTSNSVIRVRQVPFSQYALGEQAIAQVAPPIPPPPNPLVPPPPVPPEAPPPPPVPAPRPPMPAVPPS